MEQGCVYYDSDKICISIPRHLYKTVNSFPYVDICDEQLNKLLLDRILFRAQKGEYGWIEYTRELRQNSEMAGQAKRALIEAAEALNFCPRI